jgi:hypothetical protein
VIDLLSNGLFFVEELKKNPKIFWLKAAIEFVVVVSVAILFAFGLAFFLVDRNEHEKVVTYKAIDHVHVEIEVSITPRFYDQFFYC